MSALFQQVACDAPQHVCLDNNSNFAFFKKRLLNIEHDAAVILNPFHLTVCFFHTH